MIRKLHNIRTDDVLLGAGCAVSAIVLIGALLAGASLRGSVRGLYATRPGEIRWALTASAGPFRDAIADSIGARLAVRAAPILPLTGSVDAAGKGGRAHRVNIIGVDGRFWALGGPAAGKHRGLNDSLMTDSSVIINSALARKLNVSALDQITLQFRTAGALAADAPFGSPDDFTTLKLTVADVADEGAFGDFSLRAEHFDVYNVFVPLKFLQSANNIPRMATTILIGQSTDSSAPVTGERIISAVQKSLSIKDAGLNVRSVRNNDEPVFPMPHARRKKIITEQFEIYSDRVFIGDTFKNIITDAIPNAIPVSAWFVNSINRMDLSTPYSFVSTPPIARPIGSNQIELGEWIARDLNASIGDVLTLTYSVPRPVSGVRIDTAIFVVTEVHKNSKDTVSWLNRSLMPPYPGLADAGSRAEWVPSMVPIDRDRIRPVDAAYRYSYGGTPKAIISYGMAERIWGSRFGVCTAVRVPYNTGGAASIGEIEAAIRASLTQALCGILLTDVRASINSAVENGTDFAPVFLGLSVFALAAPLTLICLMSISRIKSKRKALTSAGHSRKHILLMYLYDGLITCAVGTGVGVILSPLYTLGIIAALKTVWHSAAMTPSLKLHVSLTPMLCGGAAAFACALAAKMIPVFPLIKSKRAVKKAPPADIKEFLSAARVRAIASLSVIIVTPLLLLLTGAAGSRSAAVIFFMSGAIALIAILNLIFAFFINAANGTAYRAPADRQQISIQNPMSFIDIIKNTICRAPAYRQQLSIQNQTSLIDDSAPRHITQTTDTRRLVLLNITRKKKRALCVITALACALYVLGTTQLFHHNAQPDTADRSSGTGGFALYGELNSGIPRDQAGERFLRERGVDITADNAHSLPLRKRHSRGIDVDTDAPRFLSLRMRMKDGDDASRLNLNRAAAPTLLGADQSILDSVGAFRFASVIKGADKGHPWRILGAHAGGGNTVYGVADASTIKHGLGKSVGDTLKYVNESGDTLGVILAGKLRNSILQGKVVIAESDFVRHYPSIGGYRLLLLSTPPGKEKIVADAFTEYHGKNGLSLESATGRLNAFNAVGNTYLSIFAVMGMIGLALGCAGMGIIAARDIEDRRRELALLAVQGISAAAIRRMLFAEHALVAAAGIAAGLLPAILASCAAVSWASVFRIACLLAITIACGGGAILIGLRGLKK